MAAGSQGTWYPTSFHGHFRNKSRNDFVNEFRQQAKPTPPGKFVQRLTSRPTTHKFSHHDNRFSFLNTVTSFQDGLGKKKVQSSYKSKFVPDFIAWVPHKQEISETGPLESVYRETFRDMDKPHSLSMTAPQILVNTVPKLNAVGNIKKSTLYSDPIVIDEKPITTYEFAHRHMQPNRNIYTNMNTGRVESMPLPMHITPTYINPHVPSIYDKPKTSVMRLRRARTSSAPNLRLSVADCLKWHSMDQVISDNVRRPKTASGCFPALSIADGYTMEASGHGSLTVPTLSSTLVEYQNGNHSNHISTSPVITYNPIPATQIEHSMQLDFAGTGKEPKDKLVEVVIEER